MLKAKGEPAITTGDGALPSGSACLRNLREKTKQNKKQNKRTKKKNEAKQKTKQNKNT